MFILTRFDVWSKEQRTKFIVIFLFKNLPLSAAAMCQRLESLLCCVYVPV